MTEEDCLKQEIYCPCRTQTVWDEHWLSVTDMNSLWKTHTVCDRRRLYVTRPRQSLPDTDCLWRTVTICDRHKQFVKDTDCLWQTHTVCERQRLSVTHTNWLWQASTVCDRNRHIWQKTTFYDRGWTHITSILQEIFFSGALPIIVLKKNGLCLLYHQTRLYWYWPRPALTSVSAAIH